MGAGADAAVQEGAAGGTVTPDESMCRADTLQMKYTRDTYHDGVTEIRIKALAVWDTVGTLGIPPAPVIGVRGSADQ